MKYEIMLILNPKQSEKELDASLATVKNHITENGFEIVDEDVWGHRELAYKIKGLSTGYYVVLNFTGEGAGTIELRRELNLMNALVRFLIVKMPDEYVMMRYDAPVMPSEEDSAPAAKLNRQAEELSKKIAKSSEKEEKAEKPAEKEESTDEKLDDKLKAIIDDKDIDV